MYLYDRFSCLKLVVLGFRTGAAPHRRLRLFSGLLSARTSVCSRLLVSFARFLGTARPSVPTQLTRRLFSAVR